MNFERFTQLHHASHRKAVKNISKRKRSSTTSLEIQKLQKHPILLTYGSCVDLHNNSNITTKSHTYHNYQNVNKNKQQNMPRSLSITQLDVNHRIQLINRKNPKRPSSARSAKYNTKPFISKEDKIRLKKIKCRPKSARSALNKSKSSANPYDICIHSQNNKNYKIKKPITVVTSKTPQGSFMIQRKHNIDANDICDEKEIIKPKKKKKKRKRPSSAHHIVLKHERRESLARCNTKSKLIQHIYYMEKRPIKFAFHDTTKAVNDRRESMWKLMMKNGVNTRVNKRRNSQPQTKITNTLNIATNSNSTSDLIGDMFVRHHSPKYSTSNSKRRKIKVQTTDEMDFELQSPSKRGKQLTKRGKQLTKHAKDSNGSAKKNKKGIKSAAFVMLMRAKVRIKQKKNLEKLRKEMLLKYIAHTPSNKIHPDEYIKPLSKKCQENQTKISECLAVFGRKRMRILTYIFKHIDFDKIGEISFDCVVQFDLLLIPNATQEMIFEDAHLFFKFSGLTERLWMNMLDWLLTWKLAVEKTGSFKVIDHFLNQYFNTFKEAKFRLNVIGVSWP